MNQFAKWYMFFLALGLLSTGAFATIYYVAPGGSQNPDGTRERPFATWAEGQTAASAGDTVYFRAGTYIYTRATSSCGSQTALVSAIVLNKSGSSGKMIHYMAYPGEKPVFDFYGMTNNDCRIRAIEVSANWIHLKGFEIKGLPQNNNKNHENWAVHIFGSNNIFELLNIHHIMGAGLFIKQGDGNLVLNCDSHDNYDLYTSNGAGESADGFGCHTTATGPAGNVFRGCRAWYNADDGFDCINCSGVVTIENCWNWLNGYKPGTTSSAGNGNGFKLGGFGMPPSGYPSNIPRHTIRNCVAFLNKSAGFYQNHHPVANYFYNNTGYKNGVNFNMLGYDLSRNADAGMGVYRNNIAFTGTAVSNASGADASYNSWNLSVTVTAADFQSIDTAGIYGPRKADGSLPDLKFMKLVKGSDLIDKGTKLSDIPYNGSSPDLGAYEYGDVITGISEENSRLSRSYANTKTNIKIGFSGKNTTVGSPGYLGTKSGITLYSITGRVYDTERLNMLPAGVFLWKPDQKSGAH